MNYNPHYVVTNWTEVLKLKRGNYIMKHRTSLKGRFDSMAVTEAPAKPSDVETLKGTFSISVKDDEGNVAYTNETEPYEYDKVPAGTQGLVAALKLNGAELTEDQTTFLIEALKDEKTNPAVQKVVDIINDDLKASAKASAYSSVFNEHKPRTEENVMNSWASIVRNFMKNATVSDETAVDTLKNASILPADYTIEQFRANKGKR